MDKTNDKVKHPAKYTDKFIPIFASYLNGFVWNEMNLKYPSVLDPFGGTGKLGEIKNFGYLGKVFCCEIEKEWASISEESPLVDVSIHGDSTNMDWAKDNSFSAICTSPVYGNRISDHFHPKDESHRITYRSYIGHDLHENNSGRMNWGNKYRNLHEDVYAECRRVLVDGGLFILNVSDHIRKGEIVPVSEWHKETLISLGFDVEKALEIETPRNQFGANGSVRVGHENIFIFKLNKTRP